MTDAVRFMDFLVDVGVDFDVHGVGPFHTFELKGEKVVGTAQIFCTFDAGGDFVGIGAEE